eukprot:4703895-Pyramimonas_sp.AAC.1
MARASPAAWTAVGPADFHFGCGGKGSAASWSSCASHGPLQKNKKRLPFHDVCDGQALRGPHLAMGRELCLNA